MTHCYSLRWVFVYIWAGKCVTCRVESTIGGWGSCPCHIIKNHFSFCDLLRNSEMYKILKFPDNIRDSFPTWRQMENAWERSSQLILAQISSKKIKPTQQNKRTSHFRLLPDFLLLLPLVHATFEEKTERDRDCSCTVRLYSPPINVK